MKRESRFGKNLSLIKVATGELLFPWGSHFLLVDNDWGSRYLPVNNDWGSHYFGGVIIYGYTGLVIHKKMIKIDYSMNDRKIRANYCFSYISLRCQPMSGVPQLAKQVRTPGY